jgi:hypothetical protein
VSWSDRFREELLGSGWDPVYTLESVEVGDFPVPRELAISSHDLYGYDPIIDPRRCSISHGELQIPSFVRSATTVQIGVTKNIVSAVRPGTVVRLRMGRRGWLPALFDSIFVGVIRGVTWSGGQWTLSLIDLAYSLQSRWVQVGGDANIFRTKPTTTTTGSWAPGSDLRTVITTGNDISPDGNYYVMISPIGGGQTYFLRSAARTPSGPEWVYTLPVVPSWSPARSTTAVGSVAVPVLVSETHPLNTVRRVLVSTGAGTNGTRDVLPKQWGYGLPELLVDGDDIRAHVARSSPTSGANNWVFVAAEAVEDGGTFLTEFLSRGGFFLGQRQGKLTARAAIDPNVAETVDTWVLNDGYVETYDAWDPSIPTEAGQFTFRWGNGTYSYTTATPIDTRPSISEFTVDVPYVFENELLWASSIGNRLRPYLLRRGERLTVRSAGFRLAGASPGDTLELTTDQVQSRYSDAGRGFDRRRCLVVGGGPDWFRGVTRLTVLSVSA